MKTLHVVLVGPLPPPSGGMANQTRQLAQLLEAEGVTVTVVQVNAPYRPAWIGRVRGVRAMVRLLPYLWQLWRVCQPGRLVHIMANSGWSWHLFAAPAVWIGYWRGARVLINYRGGEAEAFFNRAWRWVRPTLARADAVVVPSAFLQTVFARFGVAARIVPNIINLEKFTPGPARTEYLPHVLVTRNLEPIYDIATVVRAFAQLRQTWPSARLTVAGSGPLRAELEALTATLQLTEAVTFTGRLDNEQIATLYQQADLLLNASQVDNMPISLLEALAAGVPVVSTRAGGIPYLVTDDVHALLVPIGDSDALAAAATRVLQSPALAERLRQAGWVLVKQFRWAAVRVPLLAVYRDTVA